MGPSATSHLPASTRRERVLWFLLIFAFAFVVRAVMLWQLSGSTLLELRMGDGRVYDLWARKIAGGDWLGDEVFYQAPLYPYFLATLYHVVGNDLLVTRICQITLGAGSCAVLSQAGWRFFSKNVGIAAGLLLSLYAPVFFADAMIQKSVLDVFLVSLVLWVLGGLGAEVRLASCLGLGASIGVLILSRENALAFIFVLLPWLLLIHTDTWLRRLARAALLLAGIALVLLPVALRNWHVGGELHLTTSQFGHNFFIGNSEGADGTYRPLIYGRGDPLIERQDAIDLAEQALGRTLSPAEVSSYYTELALRYIQSQPADWIRLMARKLILTFNSVEIVDTEDQYTHAESSSLLRIAGLLLHFGTLAPFALLGVWVAWQQRSKLLPLYLLLLVYTATLQMFYLFGRYRLPMVPILVLLAAAGVVGLRDFRRRGSRPAVASCLAAIAAFALFCNWPMTKKGQMRSVTHYNIGNELAALGRIDGASDHYRQAIGLHAENAAANHNLGVLLARQGDLARAKMHFEEALRIAPGYAEARFNLARALHESGDPERAIESYRQGLAIDPSRMDGLVELGELLAQTGRRAEAEEIFERARRLDPSFAAASASRQIEGDSRKEVEENPGELRASTGNPKPTAAEFE